MASELLIKSAFVQRAQRSSLVCDDDLVFDDPARCDRAWSIARIANAEKWDGCFAPPHKPRPLSLDKALPTHPRMNTRPFRLCLALAGCLIARAGQAQYTTEWIGLFDGLSGYHSAEDLVLLPNGELITSGQFKPANTAEFYVAAFDGSGAPLWTTGLPDSIGRAWKIFELNDGSVLALGDYENQTGTNDVLVQRYTAGGIQTGEIVLNSAGTNTGDDFGDATMDAAGQVYLTGRFTSGGQTRPGLAKLTPAGDLAWWVTHPLPSNWNGFGLGLAVEAIGDSVVVMWTRNGSSYSAAVGYSSAGAYLWTTDLQVSTTDNNNAMTTDGLGHILVGGGRNQQFNVTKLAADGAVLWSTDFGFPGLSSVNGRVRHLRCDVNGDVYAVGEGPFQASIPGPYLLAAKLSSAGTVLWTDTLTGGNISNCLNMDHALLHEDRWLITSAYIGSYLYAYDTTGTRLYRQPWNVPGAQNSKVNAMVMGNDGSLYLAGRAQLTGQAGDGFVAKLTPLATALAEADTPRGLLHPVPATDRLFVPSGLPAGVVVTVMDLNGRTLLTTQHRNGIDVAGLAAGSYILQAGGLRWRFVKE